MDKEMGKINAEKGARLMSKKYCPYCMAVVSENESCSVCGLTAGTYISSPHHLPPGTVLMDRYLVGRVLGEGGFGITYIGCDLRLELKVAIKEYYPVDRATRNASSSLEVTNFVGPSAKSYERGKQKFLGEAQVMARMDKQQAIVSVRDFFEVNNTAYIVMEYIEGITFRELVEKKGGRIAPDELFPMIEPLFHALTIMHENGLIHRDISPDNLMLENGRIRLLDFGCAREASRGNETMTIALKHGYAPIEQYQQKGQGPWTDIYALSATIYYCLTGKVPPQALDRITEDDLLLPSKLGVQLSEGQEKALLKGMKLQPNRRFPSAEKMWRAIYAQSDEESETGTEKGSPGMQADAGERNRETNMVQYEPVVETEMGETGKDGMDNIQNRVMDGTAAKKAVGENTAEEGAVEEDNTGKESETPEKNPVYFFRQRRFIWGAGIAAACLALFFLIWINRRPAGKDAEESIPANTQNLAEQVQTDPHIFDNAFTFISGESDEFDRLMKDDSVPSVIMDCENVHISRAVITKPVLLSKDTLWSADSLIITDEGYLQVEGILDMSSSGYLRAYGDRLRFYLPDGGAFHSDNAFVWLDDPVCAVMEGDVISSQKEHKIILSEDVFAEDNVNSVTDFAALQRAIEAGGPISIDADIVIEDYVNIAVPVRISEDVTVGTIRQEDVDCILDVRDGGVLINHGTLNESLRLCDGGTVVNDGTMNDTSCFSVEDESTLINLGTMYADHVSRLRKNALFVNMGELTCRQLFLMGGNMANMGIVAVEAPGFEIMHASRFFNNAGGAVLIKEGGNMYNAGVIENAGKMIVGDGGGFENTLLVNNGTFEARNGADLSESGVYYGEGEYNTASDIKIYRTTYLNPDTLDRIVEVTSEDELRTAMQTRGIDAVYIRSDITAHTDLPVLKNLFIDKGCSLTMADGAAVTDYGNVIGLREGASLRGSNITLTRDAQLYMEDATLHLEENGKLVLDSSALWGRGANIVLNNAAMTMMNRAAFGIDYLKLFEANNSVIWLEDKSMLAMLAYQDEDITISGSTVTLSKGGGPSCFYTVSETDWKESELHINAGVFENRSGSLNMQDCQIAVAQDGTMSSTCSNLTFSGKTTVNNEGNFNVSGWDEHSFASHGTMTNYGIMDFGMTQMDLSASIENHGTVYYSGNMYSGTEQSWDDAWVTGNKAIDRNSQN